MLDRHQVRYVLIGGMAATIYGSNLVTTDIDITPANDLDNLGRLSTALDELGARIRTDAEADGLRFDHDATSLAANATWNLVTDVGDLDLALAPSGTQGYADLRRDAVTIEIDGVPVSVAALADVIRSKEAAGRPKDQLALPILRRLLDQS